MRIISFLYYRGQRHIGRTEKESDVPVYAAHGYALLASAQRIAAGHDLLAFFVFFHVECIQLAGAPAPHCRGSGGAG